MCKKRNMALLITLLMVMGTLSITGCASPEITLWIDQTSPIQAGKRITAGWTVTNADSSWEVVASWRLNNLHMSMLSGSVADCTEMSFVSNFGGIGTVYVIVADIQKDKIVASAHVDFVIEGPALPEITLSLNPSGLVHAEKTVTASWTASKINRDYETEVYWYLNDTIIGSQAGAATDFVEASFTYKFGGNGKVGVAIYDSNQQMLALAEEYFFVAGPALPVIQLSLDKNMLSPGETGKASWSIDYMPAGTELRVWHDFGSREQLSIIAESPFIFPCPYSGIGNISVHLLNAEGYAIAHRSEDYIVSGNSYAPYFSSMRLDKTKVAQGQEIRASWTLEGNTENTYVAAVWYVDGQRIQVDRGDSPFVLTVPVSESLPKSHNLVFVRLCHTSDLILDLKAAEFEVLPADAPTPFQIITPTPYPIKTPPARLPTKIPRLPAPTRTALPRPTRTLLFPRPTIEEFPGLLPRPITTFYPEIVSLSKELVDLSPTRKDVSIPAIADVLNDEQTRIAHTADLARTAVGHKVYVVKAADPEERTVAFHLKPTMLNELKKNNAGKVIFAWNDIQVWVEPENLSNRSDFTSISVSLEKADLQMPARPALPRSAQVVSAAYKVRATGMRADQPLPVSFKSDANARLMVITPAGDAIFPKVDMVSVFDEIFTMAEIPNGSIVMLVKDK